MAWTTAKTWSSEPLTSNDLNTYVRDNQNYLKDRLDGANAKQYTTQVTADTTSNTFVDMDATNLNLTITTNSADVAITIIGNAYNSTNSNVRWAEVAVDIDGTDYLLVVSSGSHATIGAGDCISSTFIISGLSAGDHTFKLRMRAENSGTAHFTIDRFDIREIMGAVA